MSQTTADFAFLAADVYRTRLDGERVVNQKHHYLVQDSALDPFTGFFARTYLDSTSGETIIAFRGTDDFLDGMVDLGMVAARLNGQAVESEQYTKRTVEDASKRTGLPAESVQVLVTGHSLGGGLAQLNAEKFGLKGETFNPYGIVGLRGHDREGNSPVINHVRATDVVSAASQHVGEVRVYATAAEIEALKAAGYDRSAHPGLESALRNVRFDAHYISNFDDSSLADDLASRRYEDNKALVDAFRSDVLTQRTLLTSRLDQPVLLGVHAARTTAGAMATTAVAQALATAGETVRTAEALRDTGRSVLGAAEAVAGRIGQTFSDPRMASALGSATYGTSLVARPDNHADLRRYDHPGHALYVQAHRGVEHIDRELGRAPDADTERLASALAVAAARGGMQRIDHVVLSQDGNKAFGVQGDLTSPFKQLAQVSTARAMETSVESHSRQWQAALEAAQPRQQAHDLAQAEPAPPMRGP